MTGAVCLFDPVAELSHSDQAGQGTEGSMKTVCLCGRSRRLRLTGTVGLSWRAGMLKGSSGLCGMSGLSSARQIMGPCPS